MTQLSLFPDPDPPSGQWGNHVEIERRNRIRLSIAAYAYEVESSPIMDDQTYDDLSNKINPRMSTGHARLDKFFKTNFDPFSGMWIHLHPDLEGIRRLYLEYYK